VYLILGQEDDRTILGEVDHESRQMRPEAVQKCQRRLDKRLQACVPPASMRWESVEREGGTIWIACLIGRACGTAHRTSVGAYPYRSGEDTHFASPELITAWLREPAARDADADGVQVEDLIAAGPSMASPRSATIRRDDPRAEQRIVLARLHRAVEEFTAAPPDIPRSVQGHTLDAWRPVFEPILGVFRPATDEVVEHGIRADVDGLTRLSRGVRSVFRLDHRRSGLTWIVEAPRLITRLIADRLLVDAYCSEDWQRLLAVARHTLDSYAGRVPSVLAPEYRHPETLGRDARVAGELTVIEVVDHAQRLKDTGVSDSGLRGACGALNLAFVVCAMARADAMGRGPR
jgi:hypothetical protein